MKKDLKGKVKTIADFIGHTLDEDDIQKIAQATTIDSMIANTTQRKDQHFLRKGAVGDWKITSHLLKAKQPMLLTSNQWRELDLNWTLNDTACK